MLNTRKLRKAIKTGAANEVKEILSGCPKADVRLTAGWTPLHLAVKHAHREVVEAILEAGAEIDATTDLWRTPLDLAVEAENNDLAGFLRKKGARSTAEMSLHGAVVFGDLKWVRKHVAAGTDVNLVVDEALPLCLALENRHWDIASYLLRQKCDVRKSQQWGVSPLHAAAASGAAERLLQRVVKLGSLIDPVDDCGRTPLCYAAEAGHREIADWLVDHGADVTHGRESGSTPVYCALVGNRVDLASHLIDRGAKSSLRQAVQVDHLTRARQKLNAGADANDEADPHRRESPLEMAIWNDSTEMAALLLEFGADPNQQDRAFQSDGSMYGGYTALHKAVRKGSAKMVKLLLAHGADPDISSADGLTPIELAKRLDRTHLANLMDAHIDKKLSLDAAETGIEQLYTVQKVAELLSVDDSFVLQLVKARKITSLELDEKTVRIPAGSVRRYLAKLKK